VRALADAYRAAGGVWVDTAIAGSEQARAVAISRIVGNDAPAAALFNTSRQFRDLIDQGLLITLDEVARRESWETILPEPILDSVRVGGHYYAAPVSLHMPTWIWYSKAALRKAGVAAEPHSFEELFAALDKLRAAGLIPLAHGGQAWQDGGRRSGRGARQPGRPRAVPESDPRSRSAGDRLERVPPGTDDLQAAALLRRCGLARAQLE
jgi:glucose/mannose transport system substrate-binding protein